MGGGAAGHDGYQPMGTVNTGMPAMQSYGPNNHSQMQIASAPKAPKSDSKTTETQKSHFDPHTTHPETGKIQIDSDTGMSPRRVSDLPCCFIFLLFGLLCLTLVFNAFQHGNMGRLTHGVDYYGRVCGVDAGVENMPFLFWCRADPASTLEPAGLDLDRPSCVPYCPVSIGGNVSIPCLQPHKHNSDLVTAEQFGNKKTLVFEMQESIVETAPYATRPRGGRYCIPTDPALADVVLSDNRALGLFSSNRALTLLGTLGHLWWLLALCCLVSIFMGFAFQYSMEHFPRSIVYPFTYPALLLFGIFGIGFAFAFLPLINSTMGISEWYMKQNPFFQRQELVEAAISSFVAAVVCFILAFCFYNMTRNWDSLNDSVSCADLLASATECQKKVPGMQWIPILEAIVKFLVFYAGLQGFSILASEGWVEKNRIHVNGAEFAGLSRVFIPSLQSELFYIQAGIWLLGFRWVLEGVSAFSHFLYCWCVFQWWRVKKEKGKKGSAPSGTICEGIKNAICYHMGSIFMGAWLIPLWRPWRFCFWAMHELDPENPDKDQKGIIGKIITCGGCCHVPCVHSCKLRAEEEIQDEGAATKDGFNDVAIRSNDYLAGVEKGHSLLEHSHKTVQHLYRGLWRMTLHIIGVGTCSAMTSAAVYIVVANVDIYKEPVSEYYIADPFLVTFLAFLLSTYMLSGFMNLWDHTSDCLMYCYCWHRRWARKTTDQYIPDSLRFIVGFDDTEHDRYPYYGKASHNMYLRYWLPMFGAGGGH